MTALDQQRGRLADDVDLFVLDDGGVAYCAGTQELFALNATATFIGLEFERGAAPEDIAKALSRTFGAAPADAARHVRATMDDWRTHGLLAGSARATAVAGDPFAKPLPTLTLAEPLQEAKEARVLRISLLGTAFEVRAASDLGERWLRPVFGHLAASGDSPADAEVVDVMPLASGHALCLNGRPVARAGAQDQVAPLLHYVLIMTALGRHGRALLVHAAAVRARGGDVLICGAGGSGKTSLAAALTARGMGYLAEDSVVLDRATMAVRGMPFALSIKAGGVRPLLHLYPELPSLAEHRRPDGRAVRYLPPLNAADAARSLSPPRLVLFPQYRPNVDSAPEPVSAIEAVRRLAPLFAQPACFSRDDAKALVGWLRRTPCHAFAFGNIIDAVQTLDTLIG